MISIWEACLRHPLLLAAFGLYVFAVICLISLLRAAKRIDDVIDKGIWPSDQDGKKQR